MKKKMGRPANKIPEKPIFCILGTESERSRVNKKLNNARRGLTKNLTVSQYILEKLGIRKGKK